MKDALMLVLLAGALGAADFRAGVARIDITPDGPIWMSGYASRTKPSTGVLQKLSAKALAIEDAKKGRVVIVTTDLIGLPRAITDVVAARVQKEHGLDRAAVLFNSSHTHTGPVVRPNLISMYNLSEEQDRVLREYALQLTEKLVAVIGAALGDLKPARLSYGTGQAGFAINRRQFTPKGVQIGDQPAGAGGSRSPGAQGGERGRHAASRAVRLRLPQHDADRGVLPAQRRLCRLRAGSRREGASGRHGDVHDLVRRRPEPEPAQHARVRHAARQRRLAPRSIACWAGRLAPVRPPVRAAFRVIDLNFAPHSREQFEKEAGDTNRYKVARAKAMLAAYDERRPVRSTPYPIQAIRFGKGLTLVALGGEVVVDYQLRVKREFGDSQMVVAGYSNDVMCYIPSARIIKEGGYESIDSMIYYGQPGPFAADVEETIFGGIRSVLKRVGREPVKR